MKINITLGFLSLSLLILTNSLLAQEISTITENENTKEASKILTEYELQQKILEQYKPLIKPRSYEDLIVYTEKDNSPLLLNRLPSLEESIIPGRAPNVLLIPYLRKSFAHPAYDVVFANVKYLLAVNCEDPRGFDDCSTTPHNRFAAKQVYVKFMQSTDPAFNKVSGMRIGNSYAQVKHLFPSELEIHGGGECLKTSNEWLACFDANKMAINKSQLQMMPTNDAKLLRFLKIKGKAY
jgi:hypothetical protein